jgi:hypothetical protein
VTVTAEQLDDFQQFAREKISNGGSHLLFDELVELWMWSAPDFCTRGYESTGWVRG